MPTNGSRVQVMHISLISKPNLTRMQEPEGASKLSTNHIESQTTLGAKLALARVSFIRQPALLCNLLMYHPEAHLVSNI